MYGLSENLQTSPRLVRRTIRKDDRSFITSGDAGQFLPVAFVPLLREDSVRRGRFTLNVKMHETEESLLNGVSVLAEAHFVPKLAFERFKDMGQFNRSWAKQPEDDNDPASVIPFYVTRTQTGTPQIFNRLGVHVKSNEPFNTDLFESYEALVNWQRRKRSKSLPLHDGSDGLLAQCFWQNTQLSDVVPSFDSQQIHGDVPIEFASGVRSEIHGLGIRQEVENIQADLPSREGDGELAIYPRGVFAGAGNNSITMRMQPDTPFPDIWTEMNAEGVTMSLSNFEMARKTQAFARLRNRYQSIDEEYLVDMLMNGLRIPDLELQEPIHLASRRTLLGFSSRYATDSGNLDKSVTEGITTIDLNYRMPATSTGGMILITVSIVPEQLYERQKDPAVHLLDQEKLPQAMLDALDPEKVQVVMNDDVDVQHSIDGVFGYRPLNAEWMREAPAIGGRYYKNDPLAPWSEARNRFWAADTVDPELTQDFYLCPELPKSIFSDAGTAGFEIWGASSHEIMGLTQFGRGLREATDDYEKIMAQIDQDRIDQSAPVVESEEPNNNESSYSQQDEGIETEDGGAKSPAKKSTKSAGEAD